MRHVVPVLYCVTLRKFELIILPTKMLSLELISAVSSSTLKFELLWSLSVRMYSKISFQELHRWKVNFRMIVDGQYETHGIL